MARAPGEPADARDEDLQHILSHTVGLWDEFRGQRVLITGATGFIGSWLLESLLRAGDTLGLNVSVVVLTRDPATFRRRLPGLAQHKGIAVQQGDARRFSFPEGPVSHVIHAAAEGSGGGRDGPAVYDTAVQGTARALDFARHAGAQKFLLVSSGAVYGRQPPELSHMPEDFTTARTGAGDAYAEGKRAAEALCLAHAERDGLDVKIARGHAFVGPRLPLDRGFAVGNFIRDGLRGGPIRVAGDGTAYRSYLYAADMAIWLWHILVRGTRGRAYNVGSEHPVTILALAKLVAAAFDPVPGIEVALPAVVGPAAPRYVPSTRRAAAELGLHQVIDLEEAIRRTVGFLRSKEGRASL
ncbi:MAG: NAD-dependent epimerase/dehydratase family protein [Candidatus Binatia bacterium]